MTKTCTSIQSAVYLAPNEIRTCCQRFFRNKTLCGDVVLLKANDLNSDSILSSIITAKTNLISKINDPNVIDPCTGCHSLAESSSKNPEKEILINHISIETDTTCNMRCLYCSPTYYGGEKSPYDPISIIEEMDKRGFLDKSIVIYWGGGEPTIGQDFELRLERLTKIVNIDSIRFFTNSTKLSNGIGGLLREGKGLLTTSIDAGLETTFRKVRGLNGMHRVLENLQKYVNMIENPQQMTLKYIFNKHNANENDVSAFIENLKKYQLIHLPLQISLDFKLDEPTIEIYKNALSLYDYHINNSKKFNAFFDDHFLHAISRILKRGLHDKTFSSLLDLEIVKKMINFVESNDWVIWGTGSFAQYLFKESFISKIKKPLALISSEPNIENKVNLPIKDPSFIKDSSKPIFICLGSVSYRSQLIKKISNADISEDLIANIPFL